MRRHAFNRITFDFSVVSEAVAENTLNRLSAFWMTEMETIIETSIDATIGSAGDLVLDRLVLDLGELPEVEMEAVLAERLGAGLRAEFSRAARRGGVGTPDEKPAARRDSAKPNPLRTLETYLLTGNLPAEHAGRETSIDSLLIESLKTEPDRLITLLRRIARQDQVRRRLLLQSAPHTRERLIRRLAGSQHGQPNGLRKKSLERHGRGALGQVPDRLRKETQQALILSQLLAMPNGNGNGVDHPLFQSQEIPRAEPIQFTDEPPNRPAGPGARSPNALAPKSVPHQAGPHAHHTAQEESPPGSGAQKPASATLLSNLGQTGPLPAGPATDGPPPGTTVQTPQAGTSTSDPDQTGPNALGPTADGPSGADVIRPKTGSPISDPRQTGAIAPETSRNTPSHYVGAPPPDSAEATTDPGQTGPLPPKPIPHGHPTSTEATPPEPSVPSSDPGRTETHARGPATNGSPDTGASYATTSGAPNSDRTHNGPEAHTPAPDEPPLGTRARAPEVPARPSEPQEARTSPPSPAADSVISAEYADFLRLVQRNRVPSDRLLNIHMGAWFSALLDSDGNRLIRDLRALPDREATVTELLRHLPWTDLEALICALSPTMGGLVMTTLLAGELASASQKGPGDRAVLGALWQAALALTLDPRTPTQDGTALVRRMITEAAAYGDVNADAVLKALRDGAHIGVRQDPRFLVLDDIFSTQPRQAEPGGGTSEGKYDRRPSVHPTESTDHPLPLPPPQSSDPTDPLSVAIFYLRYGSLPAGETRSDVSDGIEILINTALAAGTPARLAWLSPILADPLHRLRLVRNISTETAKKLIVRVCPDMGGAISVAEEVAAIVSQIIPDLGGDDWTSLTLSLALEPSLGPFPDAASAETAFLRTALYTASAQRSFPYSDTVAALATRSATLEGLSSGARQAITALFADDAKAPPPEPPTRHAPTTGDLADTARPPALDRLFVDNAGLVLLWPYLPRLFTMLDLLDDNGFRHTETQLRAVHLTLFLVSGDHTAPEHVLPLNKLLCGLDLSHPIGLDITPTEQETGLVHDLLYSVTQTWTPLKNTSIEGLRESFLMRNGRLERSSPSGPMTLHVESRAFDMLLDQLPWSISVVKLNWMPEALHVRWR